MPLPREFPIQGNGGTSLPPNCAICLSKCTNPSYSDPCLHQFCFKCLLKWSKIKAECPLCKQPFVTIIHNVKSTSDYEQHYLEVYRQQEEVPSMINNFLSQWTRLTSRNLQFRNTFMEDPRGEFEFQQRVLSDLLTNNMSNIPNYTPERFQTFREVNRQQQELPNAQINDLLFLSTRQPSRDFQYQSATMPPPRIFPLQGRGGASPPPNCAICLGSCTNRSYSDSCLHQFCFTCLLEWSKIKAECPLCKQPFVTIIHNVKSTSDYEQHYVEVNRQQQEVPNAQINDLLFLPTRQPSRHFQFRTTFTVDPRGEFAIQQMLLSHRLTNNVSYIPNYTPERFRRLISSTNFRRFIYDENLWVTCTPDVTGRYRDASPRYYRNNPGAINRLAPWLNRELNALLAENTQLVMTLIDTIMQRLQRYHVSGFFFKNLLNNYLAPHTDHFIHEFHSFMRSPYDMVGYDRHCTYTSYQPPVLTDENDLSSSSGDSDDVAIVATTAPATSGANAGINNPFHRPIIEVIEIDSDSSNDSDVIIQEPTPVVVDLLNTSDDDDDDDVMAVTVPPEEERRRDNKTVPQPHASGSSKISIIDVKIKKRKRRKLRILNRRKRGKAIYTSTSESESSSPSPSTESEEETRRNRKKRFVKKPKRYRRVSSSTTTSSSGTSSSSTSSSSLSSSSEGDRRKVKGKSKLPKVKGRKRARLQSETTEAAAGASTSTSSSPLKKEYCEATTNTEYWGMEQPQPSTTTTTLTVDSSVADMTPLDYSMAGFARNYGDEPGSSKAEPLHIKREYNLWFRPSYDRTATEYKYGTDDSDCDD